MNKIANLVFNSFVNDSRVLKETLSLTKAGYEVEVIAHLDKNLNEVEQSEGFVIKRFSYLNRKETKSFWGKLKSYTEYLFKSIKYCQKFDYLHCNDLNTLPVGFVIKMFFNRNVKIVYDAHEYETEVHGLKGVKQNLVRLFERLMIKCADQVICVSESIAQAYSEMYKISKPYLILNAPPLREVSKKDIFREVLQIPEHQKIFLYQGGLGIGRGIEILLETFEKFEDKNNVIVFMGYGPLEELVKSYASNNKNIYFHPAVSPNILLDYTSSADYGILFYENNCLNHNFCSPNKMFEYTMAEVPLVTSNLYEVKRLVEQFDLGVVAHENSVKGLTKAVLTISRKSRQDFNLKLKEAKRIYNWENQEKILLKLYENL